MIGSTGLFWAASWAGKSLRFVTLCLLDRATALALALVRLGLLGRLPMALGVRLVVFSLSNTGGLGLAAISLLIPARLVLRVMLGVIVAPIRNLVSASRPLIAFGGQGVTAGPPVGAGDRLALLALRRRIDFTGASKIAARHVGPLINILRRHRSPTAVIDHYKQPILVAVAIVIVADQIGIVRTRLVIIITVTVGRRLDHAHRVVITPPDPGANAVVIDGVVRRGVAERPVHRITLVGVGIGLACPRQSRDSCPGGGRQLVGARGSVHRPRDIRQLDGGKGRGRLSGVSDRRGRGRAVA